MDFLNRHQFLLRRLHSFTGIIPLGLFLLEHLYLNSFAIAGRESFDNAVSLLHSLPYLWVAELFLIFLPLLLHGLYGFYIMLSGKNQLLRYRYSRNLLFYLQRVSAAIVVAFVAWHVYTLRLQSLLGGETVTYNDVVANFSSNLIVAFYALGMVAAIYHFANGLVTFSMTWGLAIGVKSQKIATIVSGVVFVILLLGGLNMGAAFIK